MPGMSGLEMQHELNLRGATIPVIFITGHGDIPMAVEAMQHGAFDFLQKPFRDQELLDRVQRALVRDTEYRARLRHTDRIRERLASLSPREREVLDLVTQGKANKMVAGDLGVSQRTVEIHRAHVMQKMEAGLAGRAGAHDDGRRAVIRRSRRDDTKKYVFIGAAPDAMLRAR